MNSEIKEGKVKKGGVNETPCINPPQEPPVGQGYKVWMKYWEEYFKKRG